MKLLKIGIFSLGLLSGVSAMFAGKNCCCCDATCDKAECHKKGSCSCCCRKDDKCDEGWCRKDEFQKNRDVRENKSIIKTIDLTDQK